MLLTVQRPNIPGALFTPVQPHQDDEFPNTGVEFFYVENNRLAGGAVTVTFGAPGVCNFGVATTAHDAVESVAAGTTRNIGPFATPRFNDANNRVVVTYSATASVLVAAVATA